MILVTDSFINDSSDSSSELPDSNIGNLQDIDSVSGSASLTLNSVGKPVKRRRRKKKNTISINT